MASFMNPISQLPHRVFWSLPYDVRRIVYRCLKPRMVHHQQANRRRYLQAMDRHRFVFVHVNKTAGSSIRIALQLGKNTHHRLRTWKLLLTEEEYRSYFKFGFVRNPWDRVLSTYLSLCRVRGHESDFGRGGDIPKGFGDFVRRELARCKNGPTPQYYWRQSPFVQIGEGIGLDFLGYFENLESDFQYVVRRLGLPRGLRLPRFNIANESARDFREVYDDETRAIVADVYAEDIELLGYDFDNDNLPAMIAERVIA